ncbi:MFS transporter [Rhizohabitans arisaemae]|uniref:MFS transporter n=1 Tax=Rhizohabitans arisaemae TaxID=2720610 RepID=UPI0024B2247F|nr:MFS transporter [Rhizohabitans arisaemae]
MNDAIVARAPSPAASALPRTYYLALTAASTTLWAMILGPVLTTIPSQLSAIAPGDHVTALAVVTGVGGVVGILSNPLVGRISDITRGRLGRRRPWLIAGLIVIVPAALGTGGATSVVELTLWWSFLQLGANMLMAPLTATIPDLVPPARRGLASACLGISWAFAPVLGTAVHSLTGDADATYPVLTVLITAAYLLFILTLRGDRTQPAGIRPAARERRRRGDRDLTLAWLHRFLFALGQNVAISYLFFYLQDVIRYETLHPGRSTDDGVLILTAIYAPCVVVAALVAGVLSDRAHRHKVYIVGATVVFAGGTLFGAFTANWEGVLLLSALTGIGFGAYEAVSMAMVIHLLPDEERRARDLSLVNVATLIAIAVGPTVAASLIHQAGYLLMFVGAGGAVLASGLVVTLIRGAR